MDVDSSEPSDADADDVRDDGDATEVDGSDAADAADATDAADLPEGDADAEDTTPDGPPPPPFDGFDDPGWQDSTDPLCPPSEIWARRAAIGAGAGRVLMAVVADSTDSSFRLHGNDGSGWLQLRDLPQTSNVHEIAQVGESTVWYRGLREDGFGLRQDGLFVADLTAAAPPELLVPGARAVSMLDDGNGVALIVGAPGVVRNTGDGWEPLDAAPIPFDLDDLRSIWTDGDEILVAGDGGTILTTRGDEWRVSDSGTIDPFAFVAGAGDVRWAITVYGDVYRRSGDVWDRVGDAPPPISNVCVERGGEPVTAIWSDTQSLYFTRSTELLRVGAAGAIERLADWHSYQSPAGDCTSSLAALGVTGLPGGDVFLLTSEGADTPYRCSYYLLHYDGTAFRWF